MDLPRGTEEDNNNNNSSSIWEGQAFTSSEKTDELVSLENFAVCQGDLKSRLAKKFLPEGNEASNAFYVRSTELSVSEDSLDPEYRHMERESRKPLPTRTIACENIFEGQTKRGDPIRTVLTKGVTGIGKTVLTQKFTLDWAEGRTNKDIQLLFPFTFRELLLLKDSYSLVGLLHHVFSELVGICSFEHLRVMFIFDGLDERKLPLDFTQTRVLTEATETASVDALLVNLIRGSLLPSAHLWITTRPAAANQIPAECVSMVTEMRGFTDAQKKQYFMKRFREEQQATAVMHHIRTSYSLHSMSHIPAVCGMISTVLLRLMETGDMEQLPQTLTQVCIHFLLVEMKIVKFEGLSVRDRLWRKSRLHVWCLGEMGFEHLENGKFVYYGSDLFDKSLNYAMLYSSVSEMFTQILRQELVHDPLFEHQDRAYSLAPCLLEFLAAIHVHLTFLKYRKNLLLKKQASLIKRIFKRKPKLEHLLQSAIDQILLSPDENTELFLRFIVSLSLPANQSLLRGLLTQTGSRSLASQETVKYIHKNLNKCLPIETRMSLFHCLSEMSDQSLVEEVQKTMGEGCLSKKMSPAHWSALAFIILSSNREALILRNYWPCEDALLNLLPAVNAYNTVILSHCNLSQKSCGPLSSVLCASNLRHLDLSNNKLNDSGVTKLCSGLESAPCRLETLILSCCCLSQDSCGPLSSVLCSSSLRHLDLSNNDLQDSGVKLLCAELKSCRLETLRLSGCLVSVDGGTAVALAVNLSLSHLRELDLRYNHLGSSAVRLTTLRDDPQCSLDTLRLDPAGEQWMILGSGLRKYSCEFSFDPNTCHCKVLLRRFYRDVSYTSEPDQEHPPQHKDRFTGWPQVLSSTGLTGRCYWEADWHGRFGVAIAMSYRGIARTGTREDCEFGCSDQSWCLRNINGQFSACHNKKVAHVQSSFDPKGEGVYAGRVGVYLDSEAGSLSFYEVCDGDLHHLYTFTSTFTEPLFPGVGLGYGVVYFHDSVSLVRITPTADRPKSRDPIPIPKKKSFNFFPFKTK